MNHEILNNAKVNFKILGIVIELLLGEVGEEVAIKAVDAVEAVIGEEDDFLVVSSFLLMVAEDGVHKIESMIMRSGLSSLTHKDNVFMTCVHSWPIMNEAIGVSIK